jgi:hypothetical protein
MTTIHPPVPPAAGPVPALADAVADTACALADAVADGWPAERDGVLDAVDALDVLLGALAQLDDDTARLLAPAVTAAARLRRHLDPHAPDEDDGDEDEGGDAVPGDVPAPANVSAPAPDVPQPRAASGAARAKPPKRRGLGPGYQGLRL